MSTNENQSNALDYLLDATLDDLADIPEFKPFPEGAHRVTIQWAEKIVNSLPAMELKLVGIETQELSNPEASPLNKGDETSVVFLFKNKDGTRNEMAEGNFKAILSQLAKHFGITNNRELVTASQNCECLALTKIRKDKNFIENGKMYTQIHSVIPL